VRRLRHAGVDASDVPLSGLGPAAAAADLVLLEASAAGGDSFVAVVGSRAAAAVARHAGVPLWLCAGVGRRLPPALLGALVARLEAEHGGEPWEVADEVVPASLVDAVCTDVGPVDPVVALANADCPVAPELLKAVPRL
jgi:translation initiation factor 2B subunit (eIF-2B alpha/beta/delta family)